MAKVLLKKIYTHIEGLEKVMNNLDCMKKDVECLRKLGNINVFDPEDAALTQRLLDKAIPQDRLDELDKVWELIAGSHRALLMTYHALSLCKSMKGVEGLSITAEDLEQHFIGDLMKAIEEVEDVQTQ